MYLHLGGSAVVHQRDIIGVFDLDNSTSSHLTRAFLARRPDFRVVEPGVALPAGMEQGPCGLLSVPGRTGMDGFFICVMQRAE